MAQWSTIAAYMCACHLIDMYERAQGDVSKASIPYYSRKPEAQHSIADPPLSLHAIVID